MFENGDDMAELVSDGTPKVLLEAIAAGRPIVATDVPGCREAVTPGANGLLVPGRDPSLPRGGDRASRG